MSLPQLAREISQALQRGQVIPAHPLALNENRKLDERRQRALTRYYLDAGSGGIAVGVHSTQFEIRKPDVGLFQPVLELAKDEIDDYVSKTKKPIVRIAGIVGQTKQALAEAKLASDLRYHAGLLSLTAFPGATNQTLLKHCRAVSEIIPLFGFYLQTAMGGRELDIDFWREFAQIENVVAVKIAPFDRYQTFDTVRGVVESGRSDEIALYTGNDDNIVMDLITDYSIPVESRLVKKRIVGGLLGHWAVWTKSAVDLLKRIQTSLDRDGNIPLEFLTVGAQVTDCNAAFFDAANNFAGSFVGIHEVLRRQGLLEGVWTLNPNDRLSLQQRNEIDRVYKAYPELNDDAFVADHLDKWLG
ncbi:MAG: dihydrodipicolinate synthase family protein [Candidatus Aenigmarchaeota archaeon]|nr:dihydrodipicolinate synthase family protein [Candidatus Aenigmarchaeota archaeon]